MTLLPGLRLIDHEFEVPLDPARPTGESITVFAREVGHPGNTGKDLPALLFLQGGPGFSAPRPGGADGWIGALCRDFRIFLLDQRGTGRSTPLHAEDLARRGPLAAQLDYVRHFRMDGIVADCERIRERVLGPEGRWTLLGQSFGGFCSVHYLSRHPGSLEQVWITGGLPGIDAPIDEVYRLTYARMVEKNRAYYERYPADRQRVRRIVDCLLREPVGLPGGSVLSATGFQQLGIGLGMSDGMEPLHDLIEQLCPHEQVRFHYGARRALENVLHYDTNPIYALLHEGCYTQGFASHWSAQRVGQGIEAFAPDGSGDVLFLGEMVLPNLFEEHAALRPVRDLAHAIAAKADWPGLYDPAVLARNPVPVAAAVYHDDAYVPRELSLATAERIANTRVWVTNEYEHNGLRADGARIVTRLREMTER
ncbi:MAG: alpha/beta fold hydrolase [Planctomycetota bacterium]